MPEYRRELIYQELLPKLEAYNQTMSLMMSLWREHAAFLNNFAECLHLFHVPEVHDALVQTLLRHIHGGNTALRQASCKCLVNILINQHDLDRSKALVTLINQDLATSNAFQMRKTFVYFCRIGAGNFTVKFFVENFYPNFVALAADKVPMVRIEFAKSLFEIKPFIENEGQLGMELMEKIEVLKNDEDADVSEASDDMDFRLLNQRKQLAEKYSKLAQKSSKRLEELTQRLENEKEEREKRQKEEEENKFDFTTFLLGDKKPKGKPNAKPKKGMGGGAAGTGAKAGGQGRSSLGPNSL